MANTQVAGQISQRAMKFCAISWQGSQLASLAMPGRRSASAKKNLGKFRLNLNQG